MNTNKTLSLTDMVEQYTPELYSWALRKISDKELAKDLVQDTFLAAAEKIETFKGDSTHKTWLFSILNHKIIDVYRKKVKQPQVIGNDVFSNFFGTEGGWKNGKKPQNWEENEEHLLDNPEFQSVLQICMDALPENWRIAVKSKYLFNKKGEEICQELDIAPTNFWQIVHRAKLQLRNCIDTNWFNN